MSVGATTCGAGRAGQKQFLELPPTCLRHSSAAAVYLAGSLFESPDCASQEQESKGRKNNRNGSTEFFHPWQTNAGPRGINAHFNHRTQSREAVECRA